MITIAKSYWFGGVENLVQNEEGYVFWNGNMVDLLDVLDTTEEEVEIAQKIGAICNMLDSVGTEINVGNLYLFME